MAGVEDFLGKRYTELPQVAMLHGQPVPPLEQIEDRGYVSLRPLGISLVFHDDSVGSVQLHRDKHEGYSGFAGPLNGGISFDMTRDEVKRRLGGPIRSGGETSVPVLGKMPAWDLFRVGDLNLHVEYIPGNGGVRLVSVTRAS